LIEEYGIVLATHSPLGEGASPRKPIAGSVAQDKACLKASGGESYWICLGRCSVAAMRSGPNPCQESTANLGLHPRTKRTPCSWVATPCSTSMMPSNFVGTVARGLRKPSFGFRLFISQRILCALGGRHETIGELSKGYAAQNLMTSRAGLSVIRLSPPNHGVVTTLYILIGYVDTVSGIPAARWALLRLMET
jgi:hypothetical protein